MTSGISHFAIKVRDLAAAEQFYCGVLGLRIDRRWPNATGTGHRSLWVGTGDDVGTFVALEIATEPPTPASAPSAAEQPGHHLLALRITREQRSWYEERLNAAGVPVTHRTGFTIYFSDPEGNRLALPHYPDAAFLPDPSVPAGPASQSDDVAVG